MKRGLADIFRRLLTVLPGSSCFSTQFEGRLPIRDRAKRSGTAAILCRSGGGRPKANRHPDLRATPAPKAVEDHRSPKAGCAREMKRRQDFVRSARGDDGMSSGTRICERRPPPKRWRTTAVQKRATPAVLSGQLFPKASPDLTRDTNFPDEHKFVWPLVHRNDQFGPVSIDTREPIHFTDFEEVIDRDGVIRINSLDRPLDIFRAPNELLMEEFEEVWSRATPLGDGTRLPDVIAQLITKQDTGRDKDIQDIAFLEAKAERQYREKLPIASEEDASRMLERFITPSVAELALQHPGPKVRAMALQFLREMADDGNPYARNILVALK